MDDERDDDLTPEEARMFAALPSAAVPPPELEERVVAGLRSESMIRDRSAWRSVAAVAAMLVVAVALGYLGGARNAGSPAALETGPTFALLVYDPVDPIAADDVAIAVAEAQAWAGELAELGIFQTAGKLSDGGRRLQLRGGNVERIADTPERSNDLVLGGFFMIRADSLDQAQRIAADCPLLRHGSTIEIRAIE